MSLQTVKIISIFSLTIGSLLCVLGLMLESLILWFGIPGIIMILGASIFLLVFWKCPHCGSHLPVRRQLFRLRCCPRCGENLHLD